MSTLDLKSTPLRTAPPEGPFLDVEIPQRFVFQFLGQDGEWWDEGASTRSHTAAQEDGAIGIGFGPGPGIILRCIEEHADHLVCLDGRGERHIYRLLAVDEENNPVPNVNRQ